MMSVVAVHTREDKFGRTERETVDLVPFGRKEMGDTMAPTPSLVEERRPAQHIRCGTTI